VPSAEQPLKLAVLSLSLFRILTSAQRIMYSCQRASLSVASLGDTSIKQELRFILVVFLVSSVEWLQIHRGYGIIVHRSFQVFGRHRRDLVDERAEHSTYSSQKVAAYPQPSRQRTHVMGNRKQDHRQPLRFCLGATLAETCIVA